MLLDYFPITSTLHVVDVDAPIPTTKHELSSGILVVLAGRQLSKLSGRDTGQWHLRQV